MTILLIITIGYFLGSLPFSFWFGKLKGVDLRKVGSRNVGATNLARAVGGGWGSLAFILDCGKGLAAVLLAGYLFEVFRIESLSLPLVKIAGGVSAIAGHNWSVWLKFKGGKGVATSAGVFLGLAPVSLVSALVVWLIVLALSRYVSLASIIASISLPLWMWLGPIEYVDLPIIYFACITCILIIYKHRSNIKRLLLGTENKIGKK
jgi:glycerol-3-phosphate acyltransferase PlsY